MSKKVTRILKTTASALWWALLIGGVVLVVTLIAAHMRGEVPRLFGYSLINIVSGSMEPDIKKGDYILIEEVDPAEVRENDIICFYSTDPSIYGYPNTHRVVAEPYIENGTYHYVTKGDANLIPDKQPARGDRLIGRYVTNLNTMTSFLEFISNNMLMVVVLPLGLGMIVMYVGVVITTKKSVQNSAAEKEKDSDGAEN
jgi:signal peptidase I